MKAQVELGQYAWITAAMAEGYGLDEVLPLEGLEPPAWEHAELSWRTRLATDLDIHEDFRSHLGKAEDALGGEVAPLGDDLEAWVIFLRIYGDHPAPFELLAEQQLRPGDLARLHRKWARRLEEDDGLVKKADKLRAKMAARAEDGEALPLPAITVTPGSLQASPYARELPPKAEAERAAAGPPATAPLSAPGEPQLSLYDYAALCAALDDEGADRQAVLEARGLSEQEGDRLDRAWAAKMKADRALAADFRTLHRHFNEREAIRGEAMPGHDYIPAAAAPARSPFVPVVVPAGAVPGSSPPPGRAPAPDVPATPAAGPHPGPARGAPPPAAAPPAPSPAIGYNPALGMTLGVGDDVPVVDLPFRGKSAADSALQRATAPEAERPQAPAESKSKPAAPSDAPKAKKVDPHPEMGSTALPGAKLPKITLPFKAKPMPGADEAADEGAAGQVAEPAEPTGSTAEPTPAAAKPKSIDPHPEMGSTALPGAKLPKITLPFKAKPMPEASAKDDASPAAEPQPPKDAPTGTADPPRPSPKPAAAEHPDYNPDLGETVGLGDNVPIVDLPFREKLRAEVAKQKAAQAQQQQAAKQVPPAGQRPPSSPPGQHPSPTTPERQPSTPHAGQRPSTPPPAQQARPSPPPPAQRASSPPPAQQARPSPSGSSDLDKQIAGWKINHYASLCAELAEHPDQAPAIRARYGLPDHSAEAYVHEIWQMRFIEDVTARKEWQRLLKQYRDAIAKKK